ncbi:MAG: TadE family protein [Acidimicrobiales bacterium]
MVTTEAVIIMPILIAFLFLLIAAGRLTDARGDVIGAARDAARVASLQDDAGAAAIDAQAAANASVSGERLNCSGGPRTETTFHPGFQRGADVHVIVRCTVDLRDLTGVGIPARLELVGEAWERIDEHRSL